MRPVAGRMRWNTIWSGILSTKRRRPLSTSRLTRMLVPKPKNAFQSPRVQSAGFTAVVAVIVAPFFSFARLAVSIEGGEHSRRVRYPAEDSPLRFDHAQAHFVKLGEVRS